MPRRVLIIPCSGIGKVLGSVSREAAFRVLEELRPQETGTLCLARLTLGDPQAQEEVRRHPVITVDGCTKGCARVNVEQAGGRPAASFCAAEAFRRHRDLRPASVLDLGPGGEALAGRLAEEIAVQVDRLVHAPEEDGDA
ncbi:MAG: putative zinc-binding protein [Chloroflexia bacterium]